MKTNMHYGATPAIFERARQNRINPTEAEKLLWSFLRDNQLGCKFRQQHPIAIYVGDFYCHSARLVIEIDGEIHNQSKMQVEDAEKQSNLEGLGLTVLRFPNEQVLKDPGSVVNAIKIKLDDLISHRWEMNFNPSSFDL